MTKRFYLAAAVAAAMTTGAIAQTDVTAVKTPSTGTGSSKVTMSGSGRKMKTATAQSAPPAKRKTRHKVHRSAR